MVGKRALPTIDPILCKDSRARLGHFKQLGWLPPNYKLKTRERVAVVEIPAPVGRLSYAHQRDGGTDGEAH